MALMLIVGCSVGTQHYVTSVALSPQQVYVLAYTTQRSKGDVNHCRSAWFPLRHGSPGDPEASITLGPHTVQVFPLSFSYPLASTSSYNKYTSLLWTADPPSSCPSERPWSVPRRATAQLAQDQHQHRRRALTHYARQPGPNVP